MVGVEYFLRQERSFSFHESSLDLAVVTFSAVVPFRMLMVAARLYSKYSQNLVGLLLAAELIEADLYLSAGGIEEVQAFSQRFLPDGLCIQKLELAAMVSKNSSLVSTYPASFRWDATL